MYTDIHSHIIPNVDDGASSTEVSVELLNMMAAQGITNVIATPHFYADLTVGPLPHINAITSAFNNVKENLPAGIENIILGHEVHYFKGIANSEEIKCLTIGQSNYMLLEMPFTNFSPQTVNEVAELALNQNLKIILAHIERYTGCDGFGDLLELIKDGIAYGQLNCAALLDNRSKKTALRLIKDGYISFLATDTHSVEERPPLMKEALNYVADKLGSEVKKRLVLNANNLFEAIKG